jgi:hypothetical protein
MMVAVAEDGSSGQQWQQRMSMATADDNSGRQQRQLMTTAHKIGWRTTREKEESGRQTITALGVRLINPPGREREIKEIELTQKDFFQQYGQSGWIFCSH